MHLLHDGSQRGDEFLRIEPDDSRDIEELDDVDTALAGFDGGHEGLVATEGFGDVDLGHAGLLAVADQELGEALVAR